MATPKLKPATTYPSVLGAVLVHHRKAKGMPQAELAEAAGLSQPAWSRIENGGSPITIEQLVTAATALGLNPGELIAATDKAVAHLRRQGVTVDPQRMEGLLRGAQIALGLAALIALLTTLLSDSD